MDTLTDLEKKDIQGFLAIVYGDQALKWDINLNVLNLFGELLNSTESCSRYMDLVPRPFFVGNVIKWASKQARQAVIRHLKNAEKHYLICARGAGIRYKTAIYMASLGY